MNKKELLYQSKRYALMYLLHQEVDKTEDKTNTSFCDDWSENDFEMAMFDKWKRGDALPSDKSIELLERNIPNFKKQYSEYAEKLCSSDVFKQFLEKIETKRWKETFEGLWLEEFSSADEAKEYTDAVRKIVDDREKNKKREARNLNKENVEIINRNKNNHAFQKKLNDFLTGG